MRATGATPGDLANMDWGAIDRALSQTRFAELRCFLVRVKKVGVAMQESLERYVRERMVTMEEMGILRFVQTDVM